MKILFLCGSLQPGRDGVGDYTRRLAANIISQGHEAAALALNDYGIDINLEEIQSFENVNVKTWRIPASLPNKLRFDIAKTCVDTFQPEWLSLQFVIFSYDTKGLPFGLVKDLANIGKYRRWHIMFHEIWVGIPLGASKKHIFWGWLQKIIIRTLIRNLKPAIIHTQSKLYLAKLSALGFSVKYLPLFSNVPVISDTVERHKNDKQISVVAFGTIHPHAALAEIIEEVVRYKTYKNAQVSFTIMGLTGAEVERWKLAWTTAGIKVNMLGVQSNEKISQVLSSASFGISTSALAMIDKSGTTAAMLDHQLPVICVGEPWQPRGTEVPAPPKGVIKLRPGCIDECLEIPPREIVAAKVTDIAKILIETYQSFS